MSSTEVLCVGIIVADHVCTPIDHVPAAGELVLADGMLLTSGGCAANTAVDLAKMGIRSSIVGRVGDDLFGNIVREMLTRDGVDTTGIINTPGADTSQTLIIIVKGEDRRFVHTFGANARLTADDISGDLLQGVKVLYVGGYLLMPNLHQAGLVQLFKKAQAAGIKTVLDVGIPGPGEYTSRLSQLLPHVDVFLPNDDEAEIMLGESDPCQQALRFHEMGAKTVVITCGEHGSFLVNDNERLESGIFKMDYVDGSGSGDAFDAGFIVGMLRGLDARGCLSMASALGASCVRSVGTTPGVFTAKECDSFMKQNKLHIKTW
ncbi:MAG TPA: carbohydrate kinase family protein [Gemmatales bacterium]|nr:carbohydrate kinase family protein [Gemmatales bacterium]